MRKVSAFIAVLLVAAVAALLVAPSFIDWNQWKPEIEARLAAATGRAVAIEGPVTLALLPYPEASAHGLRIGAGAEPGGPDLARVGALEIRLDLGALIEGRLVAASLRLVEPVLELPLPESVGSGNGGAIGIDRLAVERGTVVWHRPEGTERIEAIDLVASVDSLSGPFRASGTARWRGAALRFDGETGALDGDRVPLAITVEAGRAGRIEARADLADGTAKGQIAASGEDLGALLALAGSPVPALEGLKYALSGPLEVSAERLLLADATVGLDEARGKLALDASLGAAPSIEARLALPSLDLDRIAAPAGGGAPFALPESVAAHVEATVGILRFKGEVVRQARLDARLDKGTLEIARAAALLPGGGDVALAGRLASANGVPRFEGSVELAADNFRELLAWLGAALPSLPQDRLRRVSLAAKLAAQPERIDIASLDLSFDATRARGAATVALRERIGIGARVALDRLVLEPYLAALEGGGGGGLPLDLNVDAAVDLLTWRGVNLGGVKLAAVLQQGAVTVREASVEDLAGATASASGELKDGRLRGAVEASGPELARLVRLWDPSWTRDLGAFRIDGNAEGDLSALALDAKLDMLGGTLSASGTAGLDRTALAVTARHPSLRRLLAGLGHRSAGEPGPLAASFRLAGEGGTWRADDLEIAAGSARISGFVALDARASKPRLEARLDAAGEIAIDPYLEARQSASLPIHPAQAQGGLPAPPDRWSRERLDLGWLAAFDGAADVTAEAVRWGDWRLEAGGARLEVADAALAVKSLDGRIFGGTLSGEGSLGDRFAAKLSLRDAALAALGLGRVEGTGALDFDVAGSGQSPYEIVSRLSGAARIAARNGRFSGIDLRAVSDRLHNIDRITDVLALVREAAGGTTRFSALDGTFRIERGIARSEDLRLVADAGEATATARLDLPAWTIESLVSFRLTDHPGSPPLGLILEGPIDSPRRSFDTRALQQYLAGKGIERLLRGLAR